ncbi:hypothetical protein [Xanthobacter agilis]|uniref:Uncharacterized protein n=1 Tax=Xanthobacter agilis TaxID=47492 RepID=A0ABU0LBC4_XANAG|nr:hypothetical protein [Xanthobacter agilis]MDQ0504436.1 hypothetical protein [Xanthobacter agilis]
MQPIRHAPVIAFACGVLLATGAHAQTAVTAKRSLNADGTTAMTYASDLSEVGTQVGLDMSAAKTTVAPVTTAEANTVSGTAYAKVTLAALPDWLLWQKGAVNVAVSPTDEETKLGTTLSRTWTVNDGLKAELADSYVVGRSGVVNGWQMDKSLSVTGLATDTTLSVGARLTDEVQRMLPSVSAQQKVLGGIQVTTTVADTGSDINKSITAGFSHRW